jgi:Domain of unknown function (DUF6468)
MTLTLASDAIVAFLLVVTIFYAARLSRRLAALRADKAELKALVASLAAASASAEGGIRALKAAAGNVGHDLDAKVQRAKSLRDDLVYIADRAATTADRLESTIRPRSEAHAPEAPRPRPVETPRPTAAATRPAEPKREAKGSLNLVQEMASRLAAAQPSRSERDLARALAGRR